MGEMVNTQGKYRVHIKGEDRVADHRVLINHDDKGVIQDVRVYGTLEEAHFYAQGFIVGDAGK